MRDPHKAEPPLLPQLGVGAWNKVVRSSLCPWSVGGHRPKGQRHRRSHLGKSRDVEHDPPLLPPWFGKAAPAPGQELLPGCPGRRLTRSSAVPAEASCPGFCSTWPAGELGEAGAGMCAGPEPARPLRHSLPPSQPMGARGTHLSAAGSGDWSAWSRHLRGEGGVALHVRRAGASLPLPSPTRRRLHCSQSLSELPPRPSKPSTAHAWTSGSFVRSLHRGRWASGLPRRQAALGRAEARPGCRGHGPGADRYSGRLVPRRPWRSCRGLVGPRYRGPARLRLWAEAGGAPTLLLQARNLLGQVGAGGGGAGGRHPGPRASLGALTSDLGRTV